MILDDFQRGERLLEESSIRLDTIFEKSLHRSILISPSSPLVEVLFNFATDFLSSRFIQFHALVSFSGKRKRR